MLLRLHCVLARRIIIQTTRQPRWSRQSRIIHEFRVSSLGLYDSPRHYVSLKTEDRRLQRALYMHHSNTRDRLKRGFRPRALSLPRATLRTRMPGSIWTFSTAISACVKLVSYLSVTLSKVNLLYYPIGRFLRKEDSRAPQASFYTTIVRFILNTGSIVHTIYFTQIYIKLVFLAFYH